MTVRSAPTQFKKIAQFNDAAAFRSRLAELGLELPVDDRVLSADEGSPLAIPIEVGGFHVANRWCIHPMEGWDANEDGSPSRHTLRRWRNFGRSGAKLIWGGEAAAVEPDGRANPRQTLATRANRDGLNALLNELRAAHEGAFGDLDGQLVGLQLTHSGRFSCPRRHGESRPRVAYHHPFLDKKVGIDPDDDASILSDAELERLVERFVDSARIVAEVGFQFVDIKACHGYLLHEFLSARFREGRYGGDFDGRTRLLREIIAEVRRNVPELLIGVRLSLFDTIPFQSTPNGVGAPASIDDSSPYRFGFGCNANHPTEIDLDEPIRLLRLLKEEGVSIVNLSCGSPYYNPHIQRPAFYPPSDGYAPPEDPLVGVARQVAAVRECKRSVADLPTVGTGYSYLQDYLPHVAQAVVREGWTDFVGIGRMVLSWPTLPADTLRGAPIARKQVCRTFSDCTTGPRNGLLSGCYPLDPYYKALPEAKQLKVAKQAVGE